MAKNQLTGGSFQDVEGNPLANGYLTMRLNQDAVVSSTGQVCSGIEITIQLDANGNVATNPAPSVWPNDQLAPANTYYIVSGYTTNGQLAWGPNNQQVLSSPSPYNLDAWVPNQVTNWTPTLSLTLQTNEVLNGSQSLLDLHAGSNVTLTDNGLGQVTIASSGLSPIDTTTPNTTDTIRWNEYGNSKWDVVTGMPRAIQVIADGTTGAFAIGNGNGPTTVANTRTLYPANATDFNGWTYSSAATASTAVVVSVQQGFGPSVGAYTFGSIRRYSTRLILSNSTNVRYWIGLLKSSVINTVYASDTPVTALAAFRYSSTTDSTIKAVCSNAAGTQTIVDTGMTVDSNSHLFDIAYTGSSFLFYIDGILKATINSNIPSAGDPCGTAFTVDNKNTATSVGATMFYSTLMIK